MNEKFRAYLFGVMIFIGTFLIAIGNDSINGESDINLDSVFIVEDDFIPLKEDVIDSYPCWGLLLIESYHFDPGIKDQVKTGFCLHRLVDGNWTFIQLDTETGTSKIAKQVYFLEDLDPGLFRISITCFDGKDTGETVFRFFNVIEQSYTVPAAIIGSEGVPVFCPISSTVPWDISIEVKWGDSTDKETYDLDPYQSLNISHIYVDDGIYTILFSDMDTGFILNCFASVENSPPMTTKTSLAWMEVKEQINRTVFHNETDDILLNFGEVSKSVSLQNLITKPQNYQRQQWAVSEGAPSDLRLVGIIGSIALGIVVLTTALVLIIRRRNPYNQA